MDAAGYRFVKLLGSGGFAVVYLVERDGKQYAAKEFKINSATKIKDIKREIKHVQMIEHHNVAFINELVSDSTCSAKAELITNFGDDIRIMSSLKDEQEKMVYMIEEYAEKSLFDLIFEDKKKFMEFSAKPIISQILVALNHLHSSGICHRDIKPQNIMLQNSASSTMVRSCSSNLSPRSMKERTSGNYTVKLIDFGLSTNTKLSRRKGGSKEFAPPEVIMMEKNGCEGVDGAKCDSFSCGVTFYLMLTGKFPTCCLLMNNNNNNNSTQNSNNYYNFGNVNKVEMNIKNVDISKMDINSLKKQEKEEMPMYMSRDCKDFLSRLLEIDPKKRMSINEAMRHPWIEKEIITYSNTLAENSIKVKCPNERLSFEKMNEFLKNELGCTVKSNHEKKLEELARTHSGIENKVETTAAEEGLKKTMHRPQNVDINIECNENNNNNSSKGYKSVPSKKVMLLPSKQKAKLDNAVENIFEKIASLRRV